VALHRSGAPAHRLEALLAELCLRLGQEGAFFSTPTAIFATLGSGRRARTHLLRLEPAGIDLGRQAAIDETVQALLAGQVTVVEAHARITLAEHAPSLYGASLSTLAFGLTSAGVAVFLGGGWLDVLFSALVGLMVGGLALLSRKVEVVGRLYEALAALMATVAANVAAALALSLGHVSVFVVVLSGVIVLVPGLTLTIAITELATRHLASGTARLFSATATFVQLGFGVVAGTAIGGAILRAVAAGGPGSMAPAAGAGLPWWAQIPAVAAAGLALTVLFSARPRHALWIVASVVVAIVSTKLGVRWAGPELGAFIGAFVVTALSNLRARLLDSPAAVTQVPGVLLLVPGAVGFRSMASFLQQDVVTGLGTAFDMVMLATSLVAGLLLANAAVRPRHAL
jgi:uncharacterized membrane protein YjjP (DUF1212 family)